MKVVVAQKGAREHYLVARALHRRGMLAQLLVDWYGPRSGMLRRLLGWLPGGAARAGGAIAPDLPRELVRSLPGLALRIKASEAWAARRGNPFSSFLRTDRAFATAVARADLPAHEVLFAYSYAALEAMEAEQARGRLTVLDQIDPGPIEHDIVREETAAWPQYAVPWPAAPAGYFDRVKKEWEIADLIVVNSDWSREGVIAGGAPAAKVEVLPLAFEPPQDEVIRERAAGTALRALWLGTVNIRKGIHYLVEAAKLLESEPVEFLIAGPLAIRQEAVAAAPRNMRWLGPVPRSRIGEIYRCSCCRRSRTGLPSRSWRRSRTDCRWS